MTIDSGKGKARTPGEQTLRFRCGCDRKIPSTPGTARHLHSTRRGFHQALCPMWQSPSVPLYCFGSLYDRILYTWLLRYCSLQDGCASSPVVAPIRDSDEAHASIIPLRCKSSSGESRSVLKIVRTDPNTATSHNS